MLHKSLCRFYSCANSVDFLLPITTAGFMNFQTGVAQIWSQIHKIIFPARPASRYSGVAVRFSMTCIEKVVVYLFAQSQET